MKESIFQVLIATICGVVAAYLNMMIIPVSVLIVVMIIDYITGLAQAYVTKTLNSRIGVIGIIKKIAYLALIVVGIVVDYLMSFAILQCGIEVSVNYCFGLVITVWLIINELISILENISKLGIPLPSFLIKIIERLKNTIENK